MVVVLPTPPFWLHIEITRAWPWVVSGPGSGITGIGRPVGPDLADGRRRGRRLGLRLAPFEGQRLGQGRGRGLGHGVAVGVGAGVGRGWVPGLGQLLGHGLRQVGGVLGGVMCGLRGGLRGGRLRLGGATGCGSVGAGRYRRCHHGRHLRGGRSSSEPCSEPRAIAHVDPSSALAVLCWLSSQPNLSTRRLVADAPGTLRAARAAGQGHAGIPPGPLAICGGAVRPLPLEVHSRGAACAQSCGRISASSACRRPVPMPRVNVPCQCPVEVIRAR